MEIVKLAFLDDNWRIDTSAKSSSARVVYLLQFLSFRVVPYGLAVRIPGFHPGGPGSTPGMGNCILFGFK